MSKVCKKTFGNKCYAIPAVRINSRAACLALDALKDVCQSKYDEVMEKINTYAKKVSEEAIRSQAGKEER